MKIIEVTVRFPKIITAEETVRMEVPGDVEDIKGYLKDEGRCELGEKAGIDDDVARDQIEILSVKDIRLSPDDEVIHTLNEAMAAQRAEIHRLKAILQAKVGEIAELLKEASDEDR